MFDIIREINNLEKKYGEEFNWGTEINREFYQSELVKETVLAPYQNVIALAKSYSNDDVLFLLDNKVYRIYHLAYSDGEPRYTESHDGEKVVEYIEKRFVDEYC